MHSGGFVIRRGLSSWCRTVLLSRSHNRIVCPARYFMEDMNNVNPDAKERKKEHSSEEGSSYDQFRAQQENYHKHSFYGKGTPQGENFESTDRTNRYKYQYSANSSTTAKNKREMAQHWEKAFFGRVHYEEGMHERYKGALDAEEEERYFDHESQGNIIDLCKKKIPSWDETEKVPQALFLARLAPNEQLQYIIYKLTFAQRRIRYAADYGGSSMMLQLQLGETALTEAEELLTKLDWMNDELQEKIEELKLDANTVKFEYDLD